MTSYRTLLFGTIAFVCAAAPALADSAHALPGPVTHSAVSTMDSAHALPGPVTQDSAHALPGPVTQSAGPKTPVKTQTPNQGFSLGSMLDGLHIPGMNLVIRWIH